MESFLAKEPAGGGTADNPADSIVRCYLGNGEEKERAGWRIRRPLRNPPVAPAPSAPLTPQHHPPARLAGPLGCSGTGEVSGEAPSRRVSPPRCFRCTPCRQSPARRGGTGPLVCCARACGGVGLAGQGGSKRKWLPEASAEGSLLLSRGFCR